MAIIIGTPGDDVLNGTAGDDQIDGQGGNDQIRGLEGDDEIFGGEGHDFLRGMDGNDELFGGDGNDLIRGGIGDDLIDAGDGFDRVSFFLQPDETTVMTGVTVSLLLQGVVQDTGHGWDILVGVEALSGTPFDDHLTGDHGVNAFLVVGGGNDTVSGEGGDDLIEVGAGDHVLDGGPGVDSASLWGNSIDVSADGATVSLLLQGSPQDTEQGMMTLSNFENLSGTLFDDALTGDGGDNVLAGDEGADVLVGGEGADTLLGDGQIHADTPPGVGTGGPPAIFDEVTEIAGPGHGDDWLEGGLGDDILIGGGGIDTASYAHAGGGVEIYLYAGAVLGADGEDMLTGIENAIGSEHDDFLIGDDQDNSLHGLGGQDEMEGGAGDDLIDGGDGEDTVNYLLAAGAVVVDLAAGTASGDGNDELVAIEHVFGSSFGDSLTGNDGSNLLVGMLGDDVIDGGAGIDTASYAHAGGGVEVSLNLGLASGADGDDSLSGIEIVLGSNFDDTLFGDAQDNELHGRAGNDMLTALAGDDLLAGANGHDALHGMQGDDELFGGAGHDFFRPGTGDDLVDGGPGFDRVSHFQTGNDTITSGVTVSLLLAGAQDTGQGVDTYIGIEALSGTAFDDVLTGDHSANWLIGGTVGGDDSLFGEGGDDLLELGHDGMHQTVDGGPGSDTASFNSLDAAPGAVIVSLELQGAAQDVGSFAVTLGNIENLTGTAFDDSLTGDAGANVLGGHDGDDALTGGAGDDELHGDGAMRADDSEAANGGPPTFFAELGFIGDDWLEGGLGDDALFGGGGIDTASYAHAGGGVQVSLNFGAADGADGQDSLDGIENLVGSEFNDVLFGDANANLLRGLAGNDTLMGLSGDDLIEGGDDADVLRGMDGDDDLHGGDGNDLIRGGIGDDVIDAGDGFDRVSYFLGGGETIPANGVTVSLHLQGVAQDTGHGWDILTGVEALSGTPFDDHLTGDHGINAFLVVGGGDDVVLGEGGDDLVEVGAGDHLLDGGAGVDSLSLWGNSTDVDSDGVTVSLALQGVAQDTEQGIMILTGFENLSGSLFDDLLLGDAGGNILAGDEGDDVLSGGNGDDVLLGDGAIRMEIPPGFGTAGPPVVLDEVTQNFGAGPGDDVLDGGRGADALNGGGGDDRLTGGKDDDRFEFGDNSGHDIITDFTKKEVIAFDVAGVDDLSDLTITEVGKDTLISWNGGSASVTLEKFKVNHLDADNFDFGDAEVLLAAAPAAGGDWLGAVDLV